MSLNKAIEQGKEHRKQYYWLSKSYVKSCRNHGGCPWCLGNRVISTLKGKGASDADLEDFYQEDETV